jgi:hypothetical protein
LIKISSKKHKTPGGRFSVSTCEIKTKKSRRKALEAEGKLLLVIFLAPHEGKYPVAR